ncbi:hypothetical protein ACWCQV_42900, partial [Streptomyces eurythermus]
EVEAPDGGARRGAPWLDGPGRSPATVRLSRAAGLPRRLPDVLGLAVRVERADGSGRDLGPLPASSGRGRPGRTCRGPAPTRWAGRTPAPCPAGWAASPVPWPPFPAGPG